jgi:hypothetical protein
MVLIINEDEGHWDKERNNWFSNDSYQGYRGYYYAGSERVYTDGYDDTTTEYTSKWEWDSESKTWVDNSSEPYEKTYKVCPSCDSWDIEVDEEIHGQPNVWCNTCGNTCREDELIEINFETQQAD